MCKIILWFVLSLIFFTILIAQIPEYITLQALPERSIAAYLFKLNKSIHNYNQDADAQIVLVGSSYVQCLENISPITNMGFLSAVPAEYSVLARLAKPNSQILCAVTVRDIAIIQGNSTKKNRVRLSIKYPLCRNMEILKAAAQYKMGILRGRSASWPGTVNEKVLAKAAIDSKKMPWFKTDRLVLATYREWPDPANVSLEYFEKLSCEIPNIIFVLFPIAPLKALPETSECAKRINAFTQTNIALRQAFEKSDLPFIILSAPQEGFLDVWHHNRIGNKAISSQLFRLFCT